MANEKTNANIGFEKELWDAACVLWGHIPTTEYRNIIIGLIFLRYISCAFEECQKKIVQTLRDEGETDEDYIRSELEVKDNYTEHSVFFVPKDARWSKIADMAHDPSIGKVIDNAMKAIELENPSLKGVLPKHFANEDLDKVMLGNVVDIFTNIDMTEHDDSRDLIGRTYEYCLKNFAEKEGKNGGEFYTPSSIVKTLVAILKPFENCRVYDPCCGSGGMFVQSMEFIKAHAHKRKENSVIDPQDLISVYGQEANPDTWKMAKINMAIRGIDADLGESQADTYLFDLHKSLRADFILANPPFNNHPFPIEKLQDDPRFRTKEQGGYGLPPESNANFAWIEHMIYHLAPKGKIGMVMANGALTVQTNGEGEIRKNIIEADLIEGIVALPTQLFYSVTLPASLWFITKDKAQKGKTLFIDARKMGRMVDRTHRDFSDEDIQKLSDTFEAFQNGTLEDVAGFCKVATTEEIAQQNYFLTPGLYVGVEEQKEDEEEEPFEDKMARLTVELSEMFQKSREYEDEIREKLGAIGYDI